MKLPRYIANTRRVRLAVASAAALGLVVALPLSAQAATAPVPLGTADSYVVLAGAGITNIGKTTLNGDVGTSPKPAITGFNTVTLNGAKHAADGAAAQAQLDLGTAFTTASNAQPTKAIPVELGGSTLTPGIYSGGALKITGTLTLDGTGNPAGVFIFKAASTLITGSASHVNLINVNPCNVFWQVTSSATLGTGSQFVGTIMAAQAASLKTGATVDGRVLAQIKSVTLEANTITKPICRVKSVTATATPTATPTATATPSPQVTAVPTGAVSTGDGSTSGDGNNGLGLLAGALLLAGLGGATVVAVRRRRLNV
ncbi:MAG TPA: ice-binding family protein [Dermatophilaceae bacterium]|nr:ice-binding family protein [Dermatophilaceae bacterium]